MNRREMLQRSGFGIAALTVPMFGSLEMFSCTEQQVAAWIQLGLNLVATVLPTLPGILGAVSSLTGKTIPAEAATLLTTQFTNVQSLFQTVQADIEAFKQSNDTTLVSKIQTVIGQIQTSLASVLKNLSITDAGTVSHIQAVVSSMTLLASDLLAILPIVSNGKIQARSHGRLQKATLMRVNTKVWAQQFNDTVHVKTDNAEVDSVFATVKAEAK